MSVYVPDGAAWFFPLQGNFSDSSGNGVTLSGTSPAFAGASFWAGGQSARFTASPDTQLTLSDTTAQIDFTEDFSISMFVSTPDTTLAGRYPFAFKVAGEASPIGITNETHASYKNFFVYTPDAHMVRFEIEGYGNGTTHHIVMIWDVSQDKFHFFVDGKPTSTLSSGSGGAGSYTNIIGGNGSSAAAFDIACLGVFPGKQLSLAEIHGLANEDGAGGAAPGGGGGGSGGGNTAMMSNMSMTS